MRVCLDDGAFLQEDLRDHRALAVNETALDMRGHALLRNAVPGVMCAELHRGPPLMNAADSNRGTVGRRSARVRLRRLRRLGAVSAPLASLASLARKGAAAPDPA